MKKNLISAAIALVTSVMTTHAQEYLNVNSKFGESQIYLLEEIDHISVRKAPQVPRNRLQAGETRRDDYSKP
jgi:hypothetical protein